LEGDSEVIETSRLAGVIIGSEADGLLLSYDRLIKIDEVTETLKPTLEGHSEITEKPRLVGVTSWSETDGLLLSRDCLTNID